MGDFLIAASPIPGHVLPLLHVGADLRARGHRVTVLTGAEHRAEVTARGLAHLQLPSRAHPRRDDGGLRVLPPLLDRWHRG
ncbi:glycosyltransferase, partial [Mycolicibacterium elephantis]